MDLGQIPLFAMLKSRMGYLTDRQKLIAENVANADTPGYAPRDLKPFNFEAQVQAQAGAVGMTATQPGHMLPKSGAGAPGSAGASGAKVIKTRDSETTLDGNQVVLEEEMIKLTDARMDYDAAVGFYQKSLDLLRQAAKAPGK